jgi:hypothetical protein
MTNFNSDLVSRMGDNSCEEMKSEILSELEDYILNDDVTMIVVKRIR